LEKVYTTLGRQAQLRWVETPTPHGLAYALRTHIYAWFERWLKGREIEQIDEPPVRPERDETLWVGRTGNVVRDFSSKTPVDLARQRAPQQAGAVTQSDLSRLLRLQPVPAGVPRLVARTRSEGLEIIAIEVTSAPRVTAPAWIFAPRKQDASRPVLLIVEPRGRNAHWREGDLYHQIAATGTVVCAVDVRGIGDLLPEVGRGAQHYEIPHAREEAYAWASLILGAPLVGQRVTDLRAFVSAFGALPETRGRRITLAALGEMAVPALFAAALDNRIDRTLLIGGLASYRSVLDAEEYKEPFANFLPGALQHTDLPQIAALAAPRKIVISGAVDGAGVRLDDGAIRDLCGSAPNVEIRTDGRWGLTTLGLL
jgi:hypothetical protein